MSEKGTFSVPVAFLEQSQKLAGACETFLLLDILRLAAASPDQLTQPVATHDFAARLNFSQRSIELAVARLRRRGMVQTVEAPGTRRRRYRTSPDMWGKASAASAKA